MGVDGDLIEQFDRDYDAQISENNRLKAKIEAANKILDELQKDNFRGLTTRVQDHIDQIRECLSQEPLTCDKSREPPCHLEPSKELCQKCELNKTSFANGDKKP